MTQYTLSLTILGKDKVSGLFDRVDRSLRSIMNTALGMTLARVFEDVAESIGRMAAQAINAVSYMQVLKITLGSLASRELVQMSDGLLSIADVEADAIELTNKLVHELGRIAILSPYTLEATTNVYPMMVAFGSTTDQAMKLTNGLLQMGAGLGASNEQIQRMGYNLAQIALQGKVTALDVRQLALAGLDLRAVLEAVGEQMGFEIETLEDFNKLWEEGKITWNDFVTVFSEKAETDFAGAAEKMARSLYGLKSTIQDVFTLTIPRILGPAFDEITGLFAGLLDSFLFIYDDPRFDLIGEELGKKVKGWIAPLQSSVDELYANLESGMGITEAFRIFGEQALEFFIGAIYEINSAIIAALPDMAARGTELLASIVQGMLAGLPGLVTVVLRSITAVVDAIAPEIEDILVLLLQAMQGVFDELVRSLPTIAGALAKIFEESVFGVSDILAAFIENFATLFTTILQLIATHGPDIIRGIAQIIGRVIKTATAELPDLVNEFADAFVEIADTVAAELPQLVTLAGKFITSMVSAIVQNLPAVVIAAIGVVEALAQGIVDTLPLLVEQGPKILLTLVNGILDALPVLITAAAGILEGLVEAITGDLEQTTSAGATILETLVTGILDNIELLVELVVPIITTLTEALLDAYPLWVEKMIPVLNAIVDALIELSPVIVEAAVPLILALANGFAEATPVLLPALTTMLVAMQGMLLQLTPLLVQMGVDILLGLMQGFLSQPELVAQTVLQLVNMIVAFNLANLPLMVQVGKDIIDALIEGFVIALPLFMDEIPGFIQTFVQTFKDNWPEIRQAGIDLINELIQASLHKMPNYRLAMDDIARAGNEALRGAISTVKTIGGEIIQGLLDGLKTKLANLRARFIAIAQEIAGYFSGIYKTDSPSKLFMQYGKDLMEGLAIGIERGVKLPQVALGKLDLSVAGAGVGVTGVSAPAKTTINNYNLTMPTSNSPADVVMAFELLRAYGGT